MFAICLVAAFSTSQSEADADITINPPAIDVEAGSADRLAETLIRQHDALTAFFWYIRRYHAPAKASRKGAIGGEPCPLVVRGCSRATIVMVIYGDRGESIQRERRWLLLRWNPHCWRMSTVACALSLLRTPVKLLPSSVMRKLFSMYYAGGLLQTGDLRKSMARGGSSATDLDRLPSVMQYWML